MLLHIERLREELLCTFLIDACYEMTVLIAFLILQWKRGGKVGVPSNYKTTRRVIYRRNFPCQAMYCPGQVYEMGEKIEGRWIKPS